ncbi:MAG: hypothetical protein ABI581_17885 [Sediminibacterium sp.]
MKLFAAVFCLLFTAIGASSQTTPEDSVKTAIGKYFTSIRNSDGIAFRQSFADSSTYININRDASGEPVVRAAPIVDMALLISSMAKGMADPRISFDMVKVNGSLASAWVPFKFYVNEQQLYCSIASFQMIRKKGVWKILYYIDRQVKCE